MTDQELVNKVLRGDTHAFTTIIKNTEGLVAQIIFKMIPVAEDRKDLAQEVYLKVYKHLSGFKFQSKLSTWIAMIAYRASLQYLEKKKLVFKEPAEQEQIVMERSAQEKVSQKELGAILQGEIDRLSPIHRTLITLYHQEQLSYEEIGQVTGLPEGTVKNYLFRARKRLQQSLLASYKKEDL